MTYENLTFSKSIRLDTGSYTFIGLYFTPLLRRGAGGEAPDGRSLIVVNCTFGGKGKGIGVLSSGVLTLGNAFAQSLTPGTYRDLSQKQQVFLKFDRLERIFSPISSIRFRLSQ